MAFLFTFRHVLVLAISVVLCIACAATHISAGRLRALVQHSSYPSSFSGFDESPEEGERLIPSSHLSPGMNEDAQDSEFDDALPIDGAEEAGSFVEAGTRSKKDKKAAKGVEKVLKTMTKGCKLIVTDHDLHSECEYELDKMRNLAASLKE